LEESQGEISTREEELQALLSKMPNRERLALRCMLARDFMHIALLYRTFLLSSPKAETIGPIRPAPEEIAEDQRPKPVLSFKQTLFD
jgi:hypothetical protein